MRYIQLGVVGLYMAVFKIKDKNFVKENLPNNVDETIEYILNQRDFKRDEVLALKLRYGLCGCIPISVSEIAAELKCSYTWVSRLVETCISKLSWNRYKCLLESGVSVHDKNVYEYEGSIFDSNGSLTRMFISVLNCADSHEVGLSSVDYNLIQRGYYKRNSEHLDSVLSLLLITDKQLKRYSDIGPTAYKRISLQRDKYLQKFGITSHKEFLDAYEKWLQRVNLVN